MCLSHILTYACALSTAYSNGFERAEKVLYNRYPDPVDFRRYSKNEFDAYNKGFNDRMNKAITPD